MFTLRTRCLSVGFLLGAVATAILLVPGESAEDKRNTVDLKGIPRVVMDSLKSRFPRAEIRSWTREKEGDDVVYDIEFTVAGRKCEADIKENGTYVNFERAIAARDLPKAVRKAVDARYPNARFKDVMEIVAVSGKAETLEGYEITMTTADRRSVEVTVAPDGKILEDSGVTREKK